MGKRAGAFFASRLPIGAEKLLPYRMSSGKSPAKFHFADLADLLQRGAIPWRAERFCRDSGHLPPVVPIANLVLYFAQGTHESGVRIPIQLQDVEQFLDLDAKGMEILRVQLRPAAQLGPEPQRRIFLRPVATGRGSRAGFRCLESLPDLLGEALQAAASILLLLVNCSAQFTGALRAHPG